MITSRLFDFEKDVSTKLLPIDIRCNCYIVQQLSSRYHACLSVLVGKNRGAILLRHKYIGRNSCSSPYMEYVNYLIYPRENFSILLWSFAWRHDFLLLDSSLQVYASCNNSLTQIIFFWYFESCSSHVQLSSYMFRLSIVLFLLAC